MIPSVAIFLPLALAGVWSASRVASYTGVKDPQYVVIDEVSGQHLALMLGIGVNLYSSVVLHGTHAFRLVFLSLWRLLNWKYLLLGFILFRVFDIWKPFPARQAESLPGGWGIMADDWIAAIYAALGLWIARYLGL